MLYTNETFHLLRELERSLMTLSDADFPLKNHDESTWMYTKIAGFIVPKFATKNDISRIITSIEVASADHEPVDTESMRNFIQETCMDSWWWHSSEFEEEGFTEDPDEAEPD